jgi:hypothetical protein
MSTAPKLDLGHVKEGIVEIDPMTDRMTIRCPLGDGFEYFDVQAALEAYRNEAVRVVIVPCSTIRQVAELVEQQKLAAEQAPKAG